MLVRPHNPRPGMIAALAIMALTAAFAAGCSAGDDGSRSVATPGKPDAGDKSRIAGVIRESFTTRDPRACRRLATQRFLNQVTFETGKAAVSYCEKTTRKASPARSIAISRVAIDGSTASARAVPEGGDSDGQQVTLALIRSAGGWKLDRMTAVQIERGAFDRAMRRALVREPDALTAEQADCVVRRLSGVSDEKLEQALIDSERSVILRPTIKCARDVFEQTIREEILKGTGNVTTVQADCVIAGLRERITDRQLEDFLEATSSESPAPRALNEALRALLTECASNSTIT